MTEEDEVLRILKAMDIRLRHLTRQLTNYEAGQRLLSNRLTDLQLAVRGVRTAARRLAA
jgi:hypothetical protein